MNYYDAVCNVQLIYRDVYIIYNILAGLEIEWKILKRKSKTDFVREWRCFQNYYKN